jgi:hypothetical protein
MARRFSALLLIVLAVLPFSAPFSTCALDDLSAGQSSPRQEGGRVHGVVTHARTVAGLKDRVLRREALDPLTPPRLDVEHVAIITPSAESAQSSAFDHCSPTSRAVIHPTRLRI